MDQRWTRPDYQVIKTRYQGRCVYCSCYFPAGVPVCIQGRKLYHLHCLDNLKTNNV